MPSAVVVPCPKSNVTEHKSSTGVHAKTSLQPETIAVALGAATLKGVGSTAYSEFAI